MKSSSYYFHMKTKISADFQICISVPLTNIILLIIPSSFFAGFNRNVFGFKKLVSGLLG